MPHGSHAPPTHGGHADDADSAGQSSFLGEHLHSGTFFPEGPSFLSDLETAWWRAKRVLVATARSRGEASGHGHTTQARFKIAASVDQGDRSTSPSTKRRRGARQRPLYPVRGRNVPECRLEPLVDTVDRQADGYDRSQPVARWNPLEGGQGLLRPLDFRRIESDSGISE